MRTIDIPDDWTAEEALTVVAFLEHLVDAVWAEHGDAMAEHSERLDRLRRPVASSLLRGHRPLRTDSDLPF
ncbi:hypothetical protein H8E07_18755 [bacterium]|nr:hypothetical protein [bacterium]